MKLCPCERYRQLNSVLYPINYILKSSKIIFNGLVLIFFNFFLILSVSINFFIKLMDAISHFCVYFVYIYKIHHDSLSVDSFRTYIKMYIIY